jgi:hypothetical protein
MSKLTALVLAGALAAVVFFWRRSEESWGSMWSSAKGWSSSWSKTAAHEFGEATDRVAAAPDHATTTVSDLADEVKGSAAEAAHKAGKAADTATETADDATTAATELAREVEGGNAI